MRFEGIRRILFRHPTCISNGVREANMATTNLLDKTSIEDSKRLSAATAPPVQVTPADRKREPARRGTPKWWMAISVVVLIATAAIYYFGRTAAPVYQTVAIDRGDIQA